MIDGLKSGHCREGAGCVTIRETQLYVTNSGKQNRSSSVIETQFVKVFMLNDTEQTVLIIDRII